MEEYSKENTKKETLKYCLSAAITYVPFFRLYRVYQRRHGIIQDKTRRSRLERAGEFLVNNPEVPLFIWDVIYTIGLWIGLSNSYQRDLFLHGETTKGSIVPYYFKNPSGPWGLPRRTLNPLEYLGVAQGVTLALKNIIHYAVKRTKSKPSNQ
jgi:hypothetical protein